MNNFTNNRWYSVIMLLLVTANIAILAMLWINRKTTNEPKHGPMPQGGPVFEFVIRELTLDSAQQQVYKKLREEHQAGIRPLLDSIRKAKDSFFALISNEQVADSQLKIYNSRIGMLEQQRDWLTFNHFRQLRAICNKEQQMKFDKIIHEVIRNLGAPKRPPGPPPPPEMGNGERRPPPPPPEE